MRKPVIRPARGKSASHCPSNASQSSISFGVFDVYDATITSSWFLSGADVVGLLPSLAGRQFLWTLSHLKSPAGYIYIDRT